MIKKLSSKRLNKIVKTFRNELFNKNKTFNIPNIEKYFNSMLCKKVKSASNQKQDIVIQLHNNDNGTNQTCGFSIKSFLGSNPTLINPGKNTNFTYVLDNCTDNIMNKINNINSKKKIIERIEEIIKENCIFEIQENTISKQFNENLQFVDTIMPEFINHLVLYSYQYNLKNSYEIIEKMKEINPLNFSNLDLYEYKYKKLLCNFALGLTPEKSNWQGKEDINGGYIVVKKNGDIVCYHLDNRDEFEQYLFEHTYFERPSINRYNYLNIYKENNQYKIKLCLQIRFK